jgi:hypothetical protein
MPYLNHQHLLFSISIIKIICNSNKNFLFDVQSSVIEHRAAYRLQHLFTHCIQSGPARSILIFRHFLPWAPFFFVMLRNELQSSHVNSTKVRCISVHITAAIHHHFRVKTHPEKISWTKAGLEISPRRYTTSVLRDSENNYEAADQTINSYPVYRAGGIFSVVELKAEISGVPGISLYIRLLAPANVYAGLPTESHLMLPRRLN